MKFNSQFRLCAAIPLLLFWAQVAAPQCPSADWSVCYGLGSSSEYAEEVVATSTGYFCVGWRNAYGGSPEDIYVIKFDFAGSIEWNRQYSLNSETQDEGYCAVATGDGGLLIGGILDEPGDNIDALLLKIDADGNQQWVQQYFAASDDRDEEFRDLLLISSTEVLAVGKTGNNMWIARIHTTGSHEILDEVTLDNGGSAWAVELVSGGGFVVAGEAGGDFYAVKLSATLDPVGVEYRVGGTSDIVNAMCRSNDGGYVLAGTKTISGLNEQVYIVKLNAGLSQVWAQNWGGDSNDRGWKIAPVSGGYAVAAEDHVGTNNTDAILLIVNEAGQIAQNNIVTGAGYQMPKALAIGAQTVTVLGHSNAASGQCDATYNFTLTKLTCPNLDSDELRSVAPREVGLAAYPNPFNPSTAIDIDLPQTGYTRLTVYDVLGREVELLQDGALEAGHHRVLWNAAGEAAGVYFARFEAENKTIVIKLLLAR